MRLRLTRKYCEYCGGPFKVLLVEAVMFCGMSCRFSYIKKNPKSRYVLLNTENFKKWYDKGMLPNQEEDEDYISLQIL